MPKSDNNNNNIYIIFTETWLTLHDIDIYKIPNYTSIHTIRNNKRGGGVAIYINNNINFNILHNLTFTIDNLIDICTIELIYNNTNIILSSIYIDHRIIILILQQYYFKLFSEYIK